MLCFPDNTADEVADIQCKFPSVFLTYDVSTIFFGISAYVPFQQSHGSWLWFLDDRIYQPAGKSFQLIPVIITAGTGTGMIIKNNFVAILIKTHMAIDKPGTVSHDEVWIFRDQPCNRQQPFRTAKSIDKAAGFSFQKASAVIVCFEYHHDQHITDHVCQMAFQRDDPGELSVICSD